MHAHLQPVLTPPFTDAQIADYKKNGGTDWQDLVYRKGHGQQHQITVTGGNDKTTFLISGNYVNQKGIVENSRFQTLYFRTNLNTQVNNKLALRFNLNGCQFVQTTIPTAVEH